MSVRPARHLRFLVLLAVLVGLAVPTAGRASTGRWDRGSKVAPMVLRQTARGETVDYTLHEALALTGVNAVAATDP